MLPSSFELLDLGTNSAYSWHLRMIDIVRESKHGHGRVRVHNCNDATVIAYPTEITDDITEEVIGTILEPPKDDQKNACMWDTREGVQGLCRKSLFVVLYNINEQGGKGNLETLANMMFADVSFG